MKNIYIQIQNSPFSPIGSMWYERYDGYYYSSKSSSLLKEDQIRDSLWFTQIGSYPFSKKFEEVDVSSFNNHVHNIACPEEKYLISAVAFAELSYFLEEIYKKLNWRPNWRNGTHHVIAKKINNSTIPSFLSFPTEDIRDEFLKVHRDLIDKYLLIYE